MAQSVISNHKSIFLILLMAIGGAAHPQAPERLKPVWWFGQSAAVNMNYYNGTTQKLDNMLSVPSAFHKGSGIRPYFSLLTEYRPNKVWGGMLNVAYDERGGTFKTVMAPCDCPATLSTNLSFISIEPSLRISPFSSALYIFGGPTMGFTVRKRYIYRQDKQVDRTGDMSDLRSLVFSLQAGLGFDIPVSAKTSPVQMTLSPFASFQSDVGRAPREIESWSIYTIRTGVAIKFGKARKAAVKQVPVNTTVVEPERDVLFSVRAPKTVPAIRQVKENFPLLNAVFFDNGSTVIPARYVVLSAASATAFKEANLQITQPDNLKKGRSARQLAVYYNILNILGDRMRNNPAARITLNGASEGNPQEGKLMAGNIKDYLVATFGIDASRITTADTDKPAIPSEQPGATKELELLRQGDRRVDVTSSSPELLLEVGGSSTSYLKPVEINNEQEDPLDSHVIFTATGSSELLKWWSLEIMNANGVKQSFGPFAKDVITIPGNRILGKDTTGTYHVTMVGETNAGVPLRKTSTVALVKAASDKQTGMRYSILFDFDKSKSITTYESFLTATVAPLISSDATVIIHGHTDVIGEEKYNYNLSKERAMSSQRILERAISKSGKRRVKFESFGFGEDQTLSPFDNSFPEERFYNRTVIIDIIPAM